MRTNVIIVNYFIHFTIHVFLRTALNRKYAAAFNKAIRTYIIQYFLFVLYCSSENIHKKHICMKHTSSSRVVSAGDRRKTTYSGKNTTDDFVRVFFYIYTEVLQVERFMNEKCFHYSQVFFFFFHHKLSVTTKYARATTTLNFVFQCNSNINQHCPLL